MKIITGLWFLFMTVLSHIPGGPSSEESQWLSRMTGVEERILRRAAHVVCFLVLTVLVGASFSATPMWVRAIVLVTWAFLDELTKALPCFPGRHYCLVPDVLLNVLGVLIGTVIHLLIRGVVTRWVNC